VKRSEYVRLDPVRGRLPRRYQMPGETDRRVNWPVLAVWAVGIAPWIYLIWAWLR
jgi:hypothetical protein